MLVLAGCGETPVVDKGEKGDEGAAGPEGPAGSPGPAGAAAVIRFVESECRQVCFVACGEGERILSSNAISPGGSFSFDADNNRVTFRPERQGVSVKIILACVQK
jgi:hypothetical protein